jgi:hypothetical protein
VAYLRVFFSLPESPACKCCTHKWIVQPASAICQHVLCLPLYCPACLIARMCRACPCFIEPASIICLPLLRLPLYCPACLGDLLTCVMPPIPFPAAWHSACMCRACRCIVQPAPIICLNVSYLPVYYPVYLGTLCFDGLCLWQAGFMEKTTSSALCGPCFLCPQLASGSFVTCFNCLHATSQTVRLWSTLVSECGLARTSTLMPSRYWEKKKWNGPRWCVK